MLNFDSDVDANANADVKCEHALRMGMRSESSGVEVKARDTNQVSKDDSRKAKTKRFFWTQVNVTTV